MILKDVRSNYKENGGLIVFKEWLLAKILRNRVVLFEHENQYFVINDIYFDDGVVVCKKTDFVELQE